MIADKNIVTIHATGTSAGTISDTTSTACITNDPVVIFTLTKKDKDYTSYVQNASKHKGKSQRWKYQNR